jgi:hypothetical protein
VSLSLPWTFNNAGLNTPGNHLDANFNATRDYINARNPTIGPIVSRPAAGNAGAIYVASDQGYRAYFDDGSVWRAIDYTQVLGAGALGFSEMATPSTPASGKGLLYMATTGGGIPPLAYLNESGVEQYLMSRYFRQIGAPIKDVVNTVTETSLWTTAPNIAAGLLGSDHGLHICGGLDYLNNTGGSRNLTIRVKYGGVTAVTLAANGAVLDSTATRYGFHFEAWIFAVGTASNQIAWARGNWADVTGADANVSGGSIANTMRANFSAHNALTVNSAIAQVLDITAQHDAANSTQSVRPYVLSIAVI